MTEPCELFVTADGDNCSVGYLRLKSGAVLGHTTELVESCVIVDYDEDDDVIGIEILIPFKIVRKEKGSM